LRLKLNFYNYIIIENTITKLIIFLNFFKCIHSYIKRFEITLKRFEISLKRYQLYLIGLYITSKRFRKIIYSFQIYLIISINFKLKLKIYAIELSLKFIKIR